MRHPAAGRCSLMTVAAVMVTTGTLVACGAPASQILAGGGGDRQTWQRAVSVAEQSVVRINVDTCDGGAKGSGFVISSGRIITNAHVVEGATRADFDQPAGANDSVQKWFANPTEDLAIVTTSATTAKPLQLAPADPVPGDSIRVAGYPLGGALTITSGRVIEFVDGELYGQPGRIIRISAAIRPGNSGGPLLTPRKGPRRGLCGATSRRGGARHSRQPVAGRPSRPALDAGRARELLTRRDARATSAPLASSRTRRGFGDRRVSQRVHLVRRQRAPGTPPQPVGERALPFGRGEVVEQPQPFEVSAGTGAQCGLHLSGAHA